MGEFNKATTYRLYIDALDRTICCPVMANDDESLLLAMEWAASLVRHSGFPVKVFRNHLELIEVPVN